MTGAPYGLRSADFAAGMVGPLGAFGGLWPEPVGPRLAARPIRHAAV